MKPINHITENEKFEVMEDFMQLFREDDFQEYISADSCVEVFLGILKGSSDITPKLISDLISNYWADSNFEITDKNYLIPINNEHIKG